MRQDTANRIEMPIHSPFVDEKASATSCAAHRGRRAAMPFCPIQTRDLPLIHDPSVDEARPGTSSADITNDPKGSTAMRPTKLRNEAADILGVTPPTITSWIHRRWLKGVLIGRRWHVTTESIERVLRQGTPPAFSTPHDDARRMPRHHLPHV